MKVVSGEGHRADVTLLGSWFTEHAVNQWLRGICSAFLSPLAINHWVSGCCHSWMPPWQVRSTGNQLLTTLTAPGSLRTMRSGHCIGYSSAHDRISPRSLHSSLSLCSTAVEG